MGILVLIHHQVTRSWSEICALALKLPQGPQICG